MSEIPWINDISQVPDASDESLTRALITCDGAGENVKRVALSQLLFRRAQYTRAKILCEDLLDSTH
jgi:hypothetical protein